MLEHEVKVHTVVMHCGNSNRKGWVAKIVHLSRDHFGKEITVLFENGIEQGYTKDWFMNNMTVLLDRVWADKEPHEYICWSEFGRANPKQIHKGFQTAEAEAKRLSHQTGIRFQAIRVNQKPKRFGEKIMKTEINVKVTTGLIEVSLIKVGKTLMELTPEQVDHLNCQAGDRYSQDVHPAIITAFKGANGEYFKAKKLKV